jgi:neuronal cell adhesion protein
MALSSIQVVIESEPYWIERPDDQNVGVSEDVTFVCDADGRPAPNKVDWYVNGKPIQSDYLQSNPRISINNKVLEMINVENTDTTVFACNVTNKHGYAWANFYLNVLAEPPEIQEPPSAETKVVEGDPVEIKCATFGAPRPQVFWRKNNQLITGGRFTIKPGWFEFSFASFAIFLNFEF